MLVYQFRHFPKRPLSRSAPDDRGDNYRWKGVGVSNMAWVRFVSVRRAVRNSPGAATCGDRPQASELGSGLYLGRIAPTAASAAVAGSHSHVVRAGQDGTVVNHDGSVSLDQLAGNPTVALPRPVFAEQTVPLQLVVVGAGDGVPAYGDHFCAGSKVALDDAAGGDIGVGGGDAGGSRRSAARLRANNGYEKEWVVAVSQVLFVQIMEARSSSMEWASLTLPLS